MCQAEQEQPWPRQQQERIQRLLMRRWGNSPRGQQNPTAAVWAPPCTLGVSVGPAVTAAQLEKPSTAGNTPGGQMGFTGKCCGLRNNLEVAKASQIINAQILYHRILTCTNIAFSSSTPYSLELSLTRRRRPLVTPSRVWWQPVTLRRSLVPCRAPRFCSAGVGLQGQTLGSPQEGRALQAQQPRTSWNCQCSGNGTNLGHYWLCWGLCVLQELLGVLLSELSLERGSGWIQTLLPHQAHEAAVLVKGAGKITQPCPLSQHTQPSSRRTQVFTETAEPAFNWKTNVVTELHLKNKGLCFRLALFFSFPASGAVQYFHSHTGTQHWNSQAIKGCLSACQSCRGHWVSLRCGSRAVQGGHSDLAVPLCHQPHPHINKQRVCRQLDSKEHILV